MSNNDQKNIVPRDCVYQCKTRIYWDTNQNAYFEVFSQKGHICPNRSNKQVTNPSSTTGATTVLNLLITTKTLGPVLNPRCPIH